MDRGSARAFPFLDPGARPVLGHGGRLRRRRPAARHARAHDPRPGRLHAARDQSADQRLDGIARALSAALSRSSRDRRRDQQGRDHTDPRRRLSVGEFRDGAFARLHRARTQARSRRGAPPQSHPCGQDALQHPACGAFGIADRVRQRRLSEDDGDVPRGDRLCRVSRAPAARARRKAAFSGSAWPWA